MPTPDIRICFLGDSFTAGIGDPENLGWVERVTAYNLGVRRDTSADILRRWRQECEPRTLPGADTRVVISFGANDAAFDNVRRRLTLDQSLANARTLLREIKARYPVCSSARRRWPMATQRPRQRAGASTGDVGAAGRCSLPRCVHAASERGLLARGSHRPRRRASA